MKNWLKNWAVIDIIALGIGLTMCIGYLFYKNTWEGIEDRVMDLWPNIATEIIGVWISVRIIEGVISRRDDKSKLRDSMQGNLNYIMSICQNIPIHFDAWRIKDLYNELIWFDEKYDKDRKRFKRTFYQEEQKSILEIIDKCRIVLTKAESARSSKLKYDEIREKNNLWDISEDAVKLNKYYNIYIDSNGENRKSLYESMNEIANNNKDSKNADTILEITNALKEFIISVDSIMDKISAVEALVKEFRSKNMKI